MPLDDGLVAAYRAALYEIDAPGGRITLRVDEACPDLDARTDAAVWAYLTTHNPRSRRLTAVENATRQAALERALTGRGLRFFRGRGRSADSTWVEDSVLVLDLPRDEAIALARTWDQAGLLVGVRGGPVELVLLLESASPEEAMTQTARGPFDVKLAPAPMSDVAAQTQIGRMSLDKKFSGDLEAVSQGEMLAFRSDGSGAYVAMERVQGRLHGRRGSFVLYHASTMTRGVQAQSIQVAPDSGTDELAGLSGSMVIENVDGKHSYVFEYRLG